MSTPLIDATLQPIADKVMAGERLSFEEGMTLYDTPDLLTVGKLANVIRERHNGNRAYFNVNRHLNPTNICTVECALCAFEENPIARPPPLIEQLPDPVHIGQNHVGDRAQFVQQDRPICLGFAETAPQGIVMGQ